MKNWKVYDCVFTFFLFVLFKNKNEFIFGSRRGKAKCA